MTASDLSRLSDFFAPTDIEWKPGATTRDKSKGLAMAYLTSRAVQQRFDDVCGPADWRNEFREGPGGGVLCGISIRVERTDGTAEWVTKWDGADNSQVEAVKGGLSGSMKRAAVQWGVGRYLYDLPATWVRLDDRGRFAEPPRIPSAFLPADTRPAGNSASERNGNARSVDTRGQRQRSAPSGRQGGDTRGRSGGPPPRSGQRRVVRPANGSSGDGSDRAARPDF